MEPGRTDGNNSTIQQMKRRKYIPVEYKGYLIGRYSYHENSARRYSLYIQYPNGDISPMCIGSIEAAKRVIDSVDKTDNTIFWDALETILVPEMKQDAA